MQILGIGNAIVDVICKVEESFIFQNNLNLWDIAAGIILVKEAGGVINEIDLSIKKNINIIASSADINSKLLEKLTNF